ncbi:DEAD_2 domain-containing protein/Helicase_C_2 domain-containing protein [Cephalotus follicularis]|uniref:DNA 5'-3' helicase FANCJ n=1 Tax=Cephalotus follicularis TaxID=3775 RepID=A0A1Q3D791_CEPFO|nr:DEAD_2 domain-containing protein/Helicase_C_2 domain-containing protein [Cephalotus follicularis]
MVVAKPVKNLNPNSNLKKSRNMYPIGGLQVEFPYQPYGSQLAFMCRVISTLDRAQREGHCHALLESPTGTGKSLSLLCSTLAWQQNRNLSNLSHSKPAPEAMTDPLGHGGGFVPETQPSCNVTSRNPELAQSAEKTKNQKKKAIPTILYASRTHSQISQVIREYRKTSYRVPMTVLASRKHYCTNPHVNGKDNIDEECKLLLKGPDIQCSEFKSMHKVKSHPSLQKGGCHEAYDIEDLVKIGQVVKGCPYYAARAMADDAQLVFCPYSYIVNPVIRGAMDIDINGAIIILDEAHNIEDIVRDAGSVDVEEDDLLKLQMELEQLRPINSEIYQPLCEMTQELISWIGRRINTLEKREFQHYVSCWTGDKALKELQEANISQQCFPILLDCATKAIKASADTDSDTPHLSGMAVTKLEGFFSSLTYFFSRNGNHMIDYQLALQRCFTRDSKNSSGNWKHTLSLWCLNSAVVFKDIAELSLSIILTSGTLSPVNSFSSELGVQFGTCLEAPHVIDVESQVWTAVISTGPDNYPLNASYKTANVYAFQDALGKSLEEICKIVPGGSLVFFPSYKLMEKLCTRWRETGQWSRLDARKSLFVEPRGSAQEDFEKVLKGYYDSISKKTTTGRKKRIKKMENYYEPPENAKKEGAAFLAVCRGKVSEGIDFTDDNARVVIIVGIPFPNINDIQVSLKKKYNDMHKSSKNLLSGNEWYCHQAFRALNQAAGRCIRHKFDYGAIILLDERYQEERNRAYISKWLRKSIRQYDSFDMSLEGLQSFFRDVKDQICKNQTNNLQNFGTSDENIPSVEQNNGFSRKKNQKLNKSDNVGLEAISALKIDATFPQPKPLGDVKVQASVLADEDINSCEEFVDLECSYKKDSRFSETISMTFSNEDTEISSVKETPDVNATITTASPGSFPKDGDSGSTVIQASNETSDKLLFSSMSLRNTCKAPYETMAVTPEREVTRHTCCLIPDMESSLNLSVNSHTQKRRKSIPLVDLTQEQPEAPDIQTPGCMSFTKSCMASRELNRRIEFGFETNSTEQKSESNVPRMLKVTSIDSSGPFDYVMDKRLRISCSFCKSPLGLSENHLYVRCSLISSSKSHLVALLDKKLDPYAVNTSSITVLMTDNSSVNQQFSKRTVPGPSGQGVWCKEDGCVYNSIFCPFCQASNNCLGVQIMATDASNVQLLNKLLFYYDRLEVMNLEACKGHVSKDKDPFPINGSIVDKKVVMNSIDKFAFSPPQQTGGWRTTKSKLRLPKRDLNSAGEN